MKPTPYTILSVSGTSGTLHIWRPSSGAPLRSQTGCTIASSSSLSLTPTRLLALTQNPSRTTSSLSTFLPTRASGGPLTRVSLPSPACRAIATSHAATFLALGDAAGVLYVYQLATGTLFRSLPAHFRGVSRLAFSDDDELLLSAGADGELLVFALADLVDLTRPPDDPPKPRLSLHAHSLPCTALSVGFCGASARVLTAGKDRAARLWHLSSGRCIATVLCKTPPTEALLSPDESVAYVGLSSGEVLVLDVAMLPDSPVSAATMPKIRPPVSPGEQPPAVTALALSPMGEDLIVGYADGVVRIYDAWSRQLVSSYARHGTTAPIDGVLAIPGEEAAVQVVRDVAKNEIEVSFDKAVDPDLVSTFRPRVVLPEKTSVREVTESVVADAVKLAFAEGGGGEPGTLVHVDGAQAQQNGNLVGSAGMPGGASAPAVVPPEVLRELEVLRRRNRELEEAGKRLLQLVDPKTS